MNIKELSVKEIDEAGVITAEFATLGVKDHDGDVTLPGAFGEQEVVMLPAHDWSSVPVGKGTTSEKDDKALAHLQMNLEIPTAQEWYSALKFDLEKGKPLQQWSYGFDVLEASHGEHEGEQVQFLKSLKVHEVSPVLVGAGIDTRTVGVKGQSITMADHLKVVDELLEESRVVLERAKTVATMRASRGRGPSQTTRDALKRQLGELEELRHDLDTFLMTGEGDSAALFLQYQTTLAKLGRLTAQER
jgi:HK97 family phage prohead protease